MKVFLITNEFTQQVYVGTTADCMYARWQQYLDALHLGIAAPLYQDILEHGAEHFILSEWGEVDDFSELKELKQGALDDNDAIDLQGMRTTRPKIVAASVADTTAAILKKRTTGRNTVAITASTQPVKVPRKAAPKPKLSSGRLSSSSKEKAVREAIAKEKAQRDAQQQAQKTAEAKEMAIIMARLDARGSTYNRGR